MFLTMVALKVVLEYVMILNWVSSWVATFDPCSSSQAGSHCSKTVEIHKISSIIFLDNPVNLR